MCKPESSITILALKTLIASLLICQSLILQSQVIYVVSSTNSLYRLHIGDCSIDFVTSINRQAYDIAFHPNGFLYGISGNGNLYRIDTLSGNTTFIHDFNGQSFNSLTIAADGLIYTIGDEGELWTFNLLNSMATFVGDIQYNATGDLAFFKGNLYVAVTGDRIVRINLNAPDNSNIVVNQNIPGSILGIVSEIVECTDIYLYAITNGSSDVYEVDLENQSLNLRCQLNITVGGGASTSEFLSSSPLSIDSVSVTRADCHYENGALTIHAIGGSGNLSYALLDSSFQSNMILQGLDTGFYQVMVTDEYGCKDTAEAFVTHTLFPFIDNILTESATCGLTNGHAEIVISGDTSGLLYSLDSLSFTASPLFDNLGPGMYTLYLAGQTNCPSSLGFEIDTVPYGQITGVDISPASCGENNGALIVSTSPSVPVLFSLDSGQFQQDSVFDDLSAGVYTIHIQDLQGCGDTVSMMIPGSEGPSLTPATITPSNCDMQDGQLLASAAEGSPPYLFAIDTSTFRPDSLFTGLSAGMYWLYVLDAFGCTDSARIEVPESDPLVLQSVTALPTNCGEASGSILLEVSGGHPPYAYAINGLDFTTHPAFTPLPQGEYSIVIRDHLFCQTETTVTIFAQGCDVYMPNVFTPNGDGINDVIHPFIIEPGILIDQFEIFDRWGNLVFLRENLPADSDRLAWDGTFRDQALMPGVYAYRLLLRSAEGATQHLKGDITLLR